MVERLSASMEEIFEILLMDSESTGSGRDATILKIVISTVAN